VSKNKNFQKEKKAKNKERVSLKERSSI